MHPSVVPSAFEEDMGQMAAVAIQAAPAESKFDCFAEHEITQNLDRGRLWRPLARRSMRIRRARPEGTDKPDFTAVVEAKCFGIDDPRNRANGTGFEHARRLRWAAGIRRTELHEKH